MKAWLRVGICLGLAILLVQLILTGELPLFVNPRFTWLIIVSVLILVLLGLVQLWNMKGQEMHRIGAWGYFMLFVPIALYLLIPPKALDASIAAKKGVTYLSAKSVNQQQQAKALQPSKSKPDANPTADLTVPEDPYKKFIPQLQQESVIALTQEKYADYYNTLNFYPQEFKGKKIKVKGFIYRDETMKKDQLVVGRFSVTCCTADAIVVGFLTEGKETASLKVNDWVEVTGTLDVGRYDGVDMPVIKLESVEKVTPLKDPYVYFVY
ncbi:TIGR03943 family putative permease subunit [Laceyella putida]|uniref:TIGR03943 family putative permease subunit n=1 Tax=Laceyella putida TaxID=110101 RepID=A0ABW2RG70_9BACL